MALYALTKGKKRCDEGVRDFGVIRYEFALRVDSDQALERRQRTNVVSHKVVSKVVHNFSSKDITRCVLCLGPGKNTPMFDIRCVFMARATQTSPLSHCEWGADLDDSVDRAIIDFRIVITQIVENVQRQSAVSSPELVNLEIFVREVFQKIFGNKTLSDGLTVPWLEYL